MSGESPIPPKFAVRFERFYPYLLLTACMLIWSGNWVLGRAVRGDIPPAALTFARWAVAALCMAPFAIPRLKGKGAVVKRHWKVIAALGFLGVGFFQVAVYTGLRYTGAINAVLMNSVAPMFIIATAWLIDGDRVTPRQFLGMAISFFGIVVIVSHGEIAELLHLHFNIGDLVIFFAMPAWGLYCVLLRRVPKTLDTLGLLFAINIAGLIFVAPFAIAEAVFIETPHMTLFSDAAVLYIGVFASFIAYICWNRGVELIGPNRAGFTVHLLPAFATVLAVVFLGEALQPYHVIGIAVVLFGVWLATSARRKQVAIAVD